jgi:cytochrome b561
MRNSTKIFTPLHRGLHWGTALLMTVLFITGFLRINWMGKKAILGAIEKNMQGIDLTNEQTIVTVKSILDPMWQWHVYAAYVFFVIIAVRIIYMLVKGIRFPNPFSANTSAKEKFQGFIYLLFYLFVIVSSITGAYLKWWNGDLKDTMETIHNLLVSDFYYFAFWRDLAGRKNSSKGNCFQNDWRR